ncbi:MAG TPA: tetratricopeptide repeat protein, partial [Steroidobacteraceae bacterium]|nr:tetratricopeptide repeat protein [Steroidobacteraceae bacterium]
MRSFKKLALVWLVAWAAAAAAHASTDQTLIDRIEMLDWSDPERAEKLIDTAPVTVDRKASEIQMLEVSGMVYVDLRRDANVDSTIADLQTIADNGDASAVKAVHYVKAYSLYQHDQYAAARLELSSVDIDSLGSNAERYRFSILRGNTLRLLGQAEAALPYLERSLDLAREMQDDPRSLHAMLWLARIYINTGNLDRASAQLSDARRLAITLGDEAALVEIDGCLSDVADRRGDRAAERRASLAALEHAKRAGSDKWLAHALVNLGDSYLKTRDFRESLKFSKQALPLVLKLRNGDEPIVLFNEGLAYIGLGQIKPGEQLAESAIASTIAGNDLLDAKEQLREYADALEHGGFLMMAIQAYHRYDELGEKIMTSTRQRAFLELSAKFDDERKARELELLRRDNALKAAEMHAQQLRQQLILAGTLFVTWICGALLWAYTRVRKANDRLRIYSERDALTGLRN